MKRKIIAMALATLMILAACFSAVAEEQTQGETSSEWPKTMYVYTENGGKLNVRSEPKTGKNVIDQLEYGAEVTVESLVADDKDWVRIRSDKGADGFGYVMIRYLADTKPKDAAKRVAEAERKKNQEELERQIAGARTLLQPLLISVRASRTSGWINFREEPGVAATKISSLPDGRQLKAIGETEKWYQAVDLESGNTGYISKGYVNVLGVYPEEEEATDKEELGQLNVNGEFLLLCRLPEGYTVQQNNATNTKITATVASEDSEKPVLQLTVAFDELYADVERMNDLSEDALRTLEETFAGQEDVEITYQETTYGTKLLIARGTEDETDYVDILSVYKGYFVEFIMTPGPDAGTRELTADQIQMCVDFLSELDFAEAQ